MPKLFLGIFSLTSFITLGFSSLVCTNDTNCLEELGSYGYCKSQSNSVDGCECRVPFFLNNSICEKCPGFGESCESSQCCNSDYLVCLNNECTCFTDEYCLLVTSMDDEERERLQTVAQVILAIALLLTATILFILFWNACTRRALAQRRHALGQRISSNPFQQSLNSIQRLVFMQLQDRPPPYDTENMRPWKNLDDIAEPPPTYFEATGFSDCPVGQENPLFFIEGNTTLRNNIEETPNSIVVIPNGAVTSIQNSSINMLGLAFPNTDNVEPQRANDLLNSNSASESAQNSPAFYSNVQHNNTETINSELHI